MKIVIFSSRFPFPLEKGDKLRLYHQLRLLSQHVKLYLVVITDEKLSPSHIEKVHPFLTDLLILKIKRPSQIFNAIAGAMRGLPFQVGWYYNRKIQKSIDQWVHSIQPDMIYCQLFRVALYCKNFSGKSVIDYMDAFGQGMKLRGKIAGFLLHWLYRWESRRIKIFEMQSYEWFQRHILISERDICLIGKPPEASFSIIPNGVDHHFFKPIESEKKYHIGFVGNLGYLPNVEAAKYIIEKIVPLLGDNMKVCISGARPGKQLTLLANEQIHIKGWMEDIRDAYASLKVFVAPVFYGTGLQNKILEAMAMGIPCVTTSAVNESVKGTHEKNILIADTPELFTAAIERLLKDENLYDHIRRNGLTFVASNFLWSNHVNELLKLFIIELDQLNGNDSNQN
ncbi:MAG TPA: glycosyltransferase [Saprospiraceae bacterium]|nr:glycosyltransferase [Saprospiraceae bacterium]